MHKSEITIGSCFSGIGGFELGIQRALKNSRVVWQIEKDNYCRSVLAKHWPSATRYTDITTLDPNVLEPPTIILGGFPCQDISKSGLKRGLKGDKSILYWDMFKIIRTLRAKIVVLENVSALVNRGLPTILGSLAEIGYDAEWHCLTAQMFGAPHRRERIFIIATNTDSKHSQKQPMHADTMDPQGLFKCRTRETTRIHSQNYWKDDSIESPFCSVVDGIPNRISRLTALGNSIVPQCSEYIGLLIQNSGVLSNE